MLRVVEVAPVKIQKLKECGGLNILKIRWQDQWNYWIITESGTSENSLRKTFTICLCFGWLTCLTMLMFPHYFSNLLGDYKVVKVLSPGIMTKTKKQKKPQAVMNKLFFFLNKTSHHEVLIWNLLSSSARISLCNSPWDLTIINQVETFWI